MSRGGRSARLLLLAAICAAPAVARERDQAPEPPPPPVGVTVSEDARARHLDAVLPGPLITVVLPRTAGGGRAVVILAADPGDDHQQATRTLFRLDTGGEGALTAIARDLPETVATVAAADLDGDGLDELFLGGHGELWWLPSSTGGPAGAPRPVDLGGLALDLRARPHGEQAHPGLTLGAVGTLARFGADAAGAPRLERTFQAPVRASRRRGGLRLSTPRATRLDRGPEQPPLYALGPEPYGARRLRTVLIDPSLDAEEQAVEVWSMLPAPESVEDSWYLMQDGRPRLAVTTLDAEKLAIFGKKRLRIFPLLSDRTRAGKNPSLKAETAAMRWQEVEVLVQDVDGDGHDDLAVLQVDGLGSGKRVIEVYRGKGTGRYQLKTHKTTLDTEGEPVYGHDFDGDGESDLLIADGRGLALYPGAVRRSKKLAVDKRPAWEIDLGAHQRGSGAVSITLGGEEGASAEHQPPPVSSLHRPQVADLDGDGRLEVVLSARDHRGRGRCRIVILR